MKKHSENTGFTVVLPVKPNGTVYVIHRRRVVSATVMFVGVGADGLTSFSVLRGRMGTTAWASMQFTEQDIGQTVFLTPEGAETKLKYGDSGDDSERGNLT